MKRKNNRKNHNTFFVKSEKIIGISVGRVGVAASNLRGGSLSSSRERRRLLPASLGSMEEVAASVLGG